MEFSDIVTGITIETGTIDRSSTDEGCNVFYDKERGYFVLGYVPVIGEQGQTPAYYGNWRDADNFGTPVTDGCIPHSGKVFLCKEDGKSYRWSGTQLTSIGSDLALGHTSSTAFPGNEGLALQEQMVQAKEDIIDNENNLASHYKQIVARSVINVNRLFGLSEKKSRFLWHLTDAALPNMRKPCRYPVSF